MGVGILAKRVVLELSSSTNFVYSLSPGREPGIFLNLWDKLRIMSFSVHRNH